MIDQLIIGDKGSFDDFGASIAERKIGLPKKKSIKETVPFSNKTYDFTSINGEIYWEERELEYIFEMTAETPEELEEMKANFSGWLMLIIEQAITDPFIPDFHFIATFDDIEFADDEGLDKTTATVKFTAYPYKVSDYARTFEFTVNAGATIDATIINNSSHRITPTITASGEVIIKRENMSYAVSAGEVTDESFMLDVGVMEVQLQNPKTTACTVVFTFFEEVL